MAHLVAWLALCVIVAWLLRARPMWSVAISILLWTLVPAVAGHYFTGLSLSPIAFHPAVWLILCTFLVNVISDPVAMMTVPGRHPYAVLSVTVFAAGALITSLASGSGGTRLLVDQIVAPFLLWWLIVTFGFRNRPAMLLVRNVILLAMAIQSGLVLLQSSLKEAILWGSDLATLGWFDHENFDRWFGTTDSPLVLSLGLAVAGGLALGVRRSAIRFSLLVLYLLGMTITQSRTGTVAMVLIILFSILRTRMAVWARALTGLAVVIIGYVVATSTLVAGLAARVANDTGSSHARLIAITFVFDNWSKFLASGYGLTSSYVVAQDAGLATSLESSYLMYVVDTGFILATLYFGTQLAIIVRYGAQRALTGATLAAVMGTLIQHTFSSAGFSNFDGTLIWAALGIVVVARSVGDSEVSDSEGSANADVRSIQVRATAPPMEREPTLLVGASRDLIRRTGP